MLLLAPFGRSAAINNAKWTSSGLYTTAIKVFMNEHHQVGKTEGTLKILARLKDQAEERD